MKGKELQESGPGAKDGTEGTRTLEGLKGMRSRKVLYGVLSNDTSIRMKALFAKVTKLVYFC